MRYHGLKRKIPPPPSPPPVLSALPLSLLRPTRSLDAVAYGRLTSKKNIFPLILPSIPIVVEVWLPLEARAAC